MFGRKKHNNKSLSDEELVMLILDKQVHEDFSILYDRYSEKVYHKCIAMVKDLDIAKDITHDVFIKVFANLSSFKGGSRFSTWLYSITYNGCIDYLRKRNKLNEQSAEDFDLPEDESDNDDQALMQLKAERLSKILDLIPAKEKAILILKYQDGSSIEDLCAITNSGESAVKMRLKRAKARVLKLYNEHYGHE